MRNVAGCWDGGRHARPQRFGARLFSNLVPGAMMRRHGLNAAIRDTEDTCADPADWLRDHLDCRPGDTLRVSPTSGGATTVARRVAVGRYEPVVVDMPYHIAAALGATSGHSVDVGMRRDGSICVIVLSAKPSDLMGMLRYSGPPMTIEDMDEAIARAAVDRFEGR